MSAEGSKLELGFAGTGTSLLKSAGLVAAGGSFMSMLIGMNLYPETLTVAGKIINMREPILLVNLGAAATWGANIIRKFIMKHSG